MYCLSEVVVVGVVGAAVADDLDVSAGRRFATGAERKDAQQSSLGVWLWVGLVTSYGLVPWLVLKWLIVMGLC